MKITEKIIALFMTVIMIVTIVPFGAFAENDGENGEMKREISYEGNSPLANIIKTQSDSQTDESGNDGYNISELETNGYEALVQVSYSSDCTLVVAVYDEDDGRMVASGSQSIEKKNDESSSETVAVELDGESFPDYYTVKAFLINDDNAPLCNAFENKEHTREFEEFFSKTPYDFDSDKVKEFDSSDGNDFFAVREDAKVAISNDDVNIVTRGENNTYIVSNADDTVKELKPGDTFYCSYGDGDDEYILVKVASVDVDGDTVTIVGENDVNPSDLFDYVRIDEDVDDGTIDTSETDDYVTIVESQESKRARARTSRAGGSESVKYKNSITLSYNPNKKLSVSGSIDFSVGLSFKFYYDSSLLGDGYFYLKNVISFDNSGSISVKLNNSVIPEIPICKWLASVCGIGVKIGISFIVELNLSADFTFKQSKGKIGFSIDSNDGYRNLSSSPKSEFKPEEAGVTIKIFAGFKFEASAKLLEFVELSFTFKIGLSVSGKAYPFYFKKDIIHQNHTDLCLDCTLSFDMSVSFKFKFFKYYGLDKKSSLSFNLLDFYVSSEPSFGIGDCPYLEYKITFEVLDENGNPVKGAKISFDGTLSSDENGKFSTYLPKGKYEYTVTAPDGRTKTKKLRVIDEAKNVTVRLSDSDEPGGNETAGGGSYGVFWKLYEDGTLYVSGIGEIESYKLQLDNKDLVKEVIIANGITGIGTLSFNGCSNIKYIDIPNSVTSIGYGAFRDCSDLTDIEIPNGVTSIGDRAFDSCTALTGIEIPDSVTSLGNNVFENCTALTGIEIPDSVTSLGNDVFKNCTALTNVEIPNGVTSIRDGAFESCTALTSVEIPDSVTSLGNDVFKNCTALTNVEIPNGVTSLGNNAFENCASLSNIVIPDSITNIGANAFENCTALANIEIPKSVTSIGDDVFSGCSGLTSFNIPESVTSVVNGMFYGCFNLTSIEIPDNVTRIGNYAFRGCSGLANVEMPNSVISIGNVAFDGCSALTSIEIPNSVTNIGMWAFRDCSGLTNIVTPDSVENLGYGAFENCSGLTSVKISDSIISIEGSTFADCSNLTSIVIPDRVTSIGDYAFDSCSALTNVEIPNGVTSIGNSAFSMCFSLSDVKIPNSVTSIGYMAFSYCHSLTSIKIPYSVTYIGDGAFGSSNNFEKVEVDSKNQNYTSINGVLYNKSVTELVLYPNNLQGVYTIPESVTSIRDSAFSGCHELTGVVMPDGVTSIGDYAFRLCFELKTIVLPESVTCIGNYVFMQCSSLKTIVIPDSVTSIGERAFSDCSDLETVYYKGTREQWNEIAVDSGNEDLTNANIIYNYNQSQIESNSDVVTLNASNVKVKPVYNMSARAQAVKNSAYTQQINNAQTGYDYLFIAVIDKDAEDLFAQDNLLYINQYTANSETLSVSYMPKSTDIDFQTEFIQGVFTSETPSVDPDDPDEPTTEPKTDSTTKPTEPATKPTEPATKSTEPATKPTEPATKPTEPATKPTEPATKPTGPATKPTGPATKPTEPATKPTEPTTKSTEPATKLTEPATKPTEPAMDSTEPATKPTEPATKPTEPATKLTEPATKPTEPATKPTESSTKTTTPAPTTNPTEDTTKSFMLGDLNFDGKITSKDARIALRVAARLEKVNDDVVKAGDLNSDGKITAIESRVILRYAARLISVLV